VGGRGKRKSANLLLKKGEAGKDANPNAKEKEEKQKEKEEKQKENEENPAKDVKSFIKTYINLGL
jgi:ribosomal protein L9